MIHVDIGCFVLMGGEGESGLQIDACWALLLSSTGVTYHQQAGGLRCDHPSAEGFLAPVQGEATEIAFKTDNWGWGDPPSVEEVSEVQALVRDCQLLMMVPKTFDSSRPLAPRHWITKEYSIDLDQDRMDQAQEAWLPIVVPELNMKGWLVYENSD